MPSNCTAPLNLSEQQIYFYVNKLRPILSLTDNTSTVLTVSLNLIDLKATNSGISHKAHFTIINRSTRLAGHVLTSRPVDFAFLSTFPTLLSRQARCAPSDNLLSPQPTTKPLPQTETSHIRDPCWLYMTWWDNLWHPLRAVSGKFDKRCLRRGGGGGGALHQRGSCATEGCCGGDSFGPVWSQRKDKTMYKCRPLFCHLWCHFTTVQKIFVSLSESGWYGQIK